MGHKESVRAYTYGISTVGSVLDLCLMELHLLLVYYRLHFGVFRSYDFEKIFGKDFGTRDLTLVWSSVDHE